MRSRQPRLRPAQLAAGASLLAVAGSVAAATATPVQAQNATVLRVQSHHLAPGRALTVTGTTSSSAAGQPVALQFAPAGSSRWRDLAYGRVARNGGFRLRGTLRRSGRVRVLGTAGAPGSDAPSSGRTAGGGTPGRSAAADLSTPAESPSSPGSVPPSASQRVTVGSAILLRGGGHDVLAGQTVTVAGRLLPGAAGRWVRLEGRASGRWHVLTLARTGGRGGFALHLRAREAGSHAIRVTFSGDRLNTGASHGAGAYSVLRAAMASWYDDGGSTACGFHAGMGVASPYLPCGTQVTFRYGGRTVTAVVDDRGPYVSGRDYDLNQNTAGALGFGGVDTVWASR